MARTVMIGVMIVGSIAGLAWGPDRVTFGARALAIALIWVGCIPALLFLGAPTDMRRTFPLLPLTGLFYAFFFGLPVFCAGFLWSDVQGGFAFLNFVAIDHIDATPVALALAGTASLIGAWATVRHVAGQRLPALRIAAPDDGRVLAALAYPLAVAPVIYRMLPSDLAIASFWQVLSPGGYMAFAIFAILLLRRRVALRWLLPYFVIVLPVMVSQIAAGGSLTPLMVLGVFAAALYFRERQRLPIAILAAIVLVLSLVYPTLGYYRYHVWTMPNSYSTLEKIGILAEQLTTQAKDEDRRTDGQNRLVRRISHILPFAYVVDRSPDPTPFWRGETYRPLLTSWVPRFLWPGKPQERMGHVFGVRYGMVSPDNPHMSMNIPWLTEAYANFGAWGCVFVMALIGIFMGFVEAVINRPGASIAEFSLGAAVLAPLWFADSNLSLMTGSLLPVIIMLWIYMTLGARLVGWLVPTDNK